MADRWITRHGSPRAGFRYRGPTALPVRDRRTLARIAALGIPPAWRDVHISASPRAAIQAWGFDARGRRQYRYHERAVERGDLRKYYRVRQLARELPHIRRALARDLRRNDLSRQHVAAAAVRLLNDAFFRVGNDRYASENKSFGLTTLRKSHVTIEGDAVSFEFVGKAGKRQWRQISDRRLARLLGALTAAPGSRLWRFQDEEGRWCDLTAQDVNDYVREVTGERYTAKDFRTWGGTLRFATVLAELGAPESERERKKNVVTAVRLVASELGNTPAICRRSYVQPIVISRYLDDGETIRIAAPRARAARGIDHAPEERALIRFLDEHFPERRKRKRVEENGDG